MNDTQPLLARIEDDRATNKAPCKSYATEAKAETVAARLSVEYANYFTMKGNDVVPCRYIVAFNEAWGRWIVGFDFAELLSRKATTGGYLGIASRDGFYTY